MNRRTRISVIAVLVVLGALLALGGAVYAALPGNQSSAPGGTSTGTNTQRTGQDAAGKIAPRLLALFQAQPAGTMLEYWVILKDQADTSNTIPTAQWAAKGWYVYNALTKQAAATQPPVLAQLQALQSARHVSAIQSFWIINSFVVSCDLASPQALSGNPAVG